MANKTMSFIKEAQIELKKVSWPTRTEVKGATMVVIVLTTLVGIYIGVIDAIVSRIITFLIR